DESQGKFVDAKWTSDTKPQVITGLTGGETYTLKETTAPQGYEVTTDTQFTLKKDGTVDTSSVQNPTTYVNGVLLIEDDMTSVKISKIDVMSQAEIAGAKIEILEEDGKTPAQMWDDTDKKFVDAKWTSGTSAKEIVGLTGGKTYVLRETSAPQGYTVTTDTQFTLKKDGTVDTSSVTNPTTIGTSGNLKDVLLVEDGPTAVKISKVDINGKQEVAGAKLRIVDDQGKIVQMYDVTQKKYVDAEWTSTTSAKSIIGLETGKTYTLQETTAPDGYAVTTDSTFSIDKDGNVNYSGTTSKNGTLLVEDGMTKVKISKVDATGKQEVAGAKIEIVDSNGKTAQMWDDTQKKFVDAKWTSDTKPQ
ncbi:MAG: hypothetical protein HUJ90_01495, partial [Bacteroidales bacterium]|nr:hypothetical protein [Bacteroidales bacterium]